MELIITLLALLPFVLIFGLIVVLKWSALKTMPLVWLTTAVIAFFVWRLDIIWISASFIKGTLIALEIMLIIFGAVWIIEILKKKKQIHFLQNLLSSISPDIRIQALIIAFLFGAMIEGVAGFGTPAALAAPLLVSLGFTPLLAVVISLIANSSPVSFGAAGTPILLGLGGLGFESNILQEVTKNVALYHSIASFIVPLAIVYFVIKFSKEKEKKKAFIETLPFCIFVWLAFAIPFLLVAIYVGPELPSIVGGFVGLFVVSLAAHYKILTPKNVITFNKGKRKKLNLKKSLLSITPYALIIIFLTLSRIIPNIKNTLTNISLDINNILTTNVNYSFLPFFTPSFTFILVGIICLFIFKANFKEAKITLKNTLNKVKLPTIALIFVLALVQLFIISGNNSLNIPSMPLLLAQASSALLGKFFILLSPFIGLFGSFIAGSNTVSNLLFGSFQAETAKALGISVITILSLQVVGGAIGNMIALHNVLAASATVGLKNQEGNIIRKTLVISLLYAAIVAVIAVVVVLL